MRALLFGSIALALAGCASEAAVVDDAAEVEAPAAASVATIEASALADRIAAGEVQLIDVRTPEEYAEGHIEGAILMPVDAFDPAAIPAAEGKETILYCRSARRSERAATMLAEARGDTAVHLEGGIKAWQEAELPVVTP